MATQPTTGTGTPPSTASAPGSAAGGRGRGGGGVRSQRLRMGVGARERRRAGVPAPASTLRHAPGESGEGRGRARAATVALRHRHVGYQGAGRAWGAPPASLEVGDAAEGLAMVEDSDEILVLLRLLVRDGMVVPSEVAAVRSRALWGNGYSAVCSV
jgi:hypothetical protein